MYAVVIFAVLFAGCSSANINKHMTLLSELDNKIQPHAARAPRRFLTISSAPPARAAHAPALALPLTCEAFGAPAPTIRWFRNDQPVYEHNQESNEIVDVSPTSLAKVTSTLLVPRTEGEDKYTCVATAGGKTVRAHSVVYSAGDGSTELDPVRLVPLAPRILVSYKVLMDLIGSSVVLPCRARGHPRPQVTWRNNRGAIVKRDPRMKVLRSGELTISPLLWSDMGEFSCVAANSFGRRLATTFVYPASVSRMNKVKH